MSKSKLEPHLKDVIPLRACIDCEKVALTEDDLNEFVLDMRYRHNKKNLCITCYKERSKIYNIKNERNSQARLRRDKLKWEFIQLLGGECEECGVDNPVVLCFHHIDPNEKETSTIYQRPNHIRELIIEGKMRLLCQNCHLLVHNKEKEEVFARFFFNSIRRKNRKV